MTRKMREFKKQLQENAKKEAASGTYDISKDMGVSIKEKDLEACEKFLMDLQKILGGKYELVGSCNKDISRYLIPIGTEKQISYYGKPEKSFRISDHWNWYSSTKKCRDISYVQCESVDMPAARERKDWHATKPRKGLQVAVQGTDGKYHHVFGYKWSEAERNFKWIENRPMDICKELGLV